MDNTRDKVLPVSEFYAHVDQIDDVGSRQQVINEYAWIRPLYAPYTRVILQAAVVLATFTPVADFACKRRGLAFCRPDAKHE